MQAAEDAPKMKFRTCLVLPNISKKNALDDVFWMAVYNSAINCITMLVVVVGVKRPEIGGT